KHEVAAPIRAAVHAVSHDALRHCALIEALLPRLIARAPAPQVSGLLAAALSQLIVGAYRDHALVDQAVAAARSDRHLSAAAGFVNAVLRSFLRRRAVLVPQLLLDDATRLNVPRWWLQRLRREHPEHWERALACAAPGGKTGHRAELSDARIDAIERDPARAGLITDNLQRLGLAAPRIRILTADARDVASFWDGHPYQRMLVDAPCTASGIVRRHPDIPWLRREADVAQLTTLQAGLLDALWRLLAPAGRL